MAKWNKEKIKEAIIEVMERLGHFPSQTEIVKIKRYDLVNAIRTYTSFGELREELSIPSSRVRRGYWQKKENIVLEVRKFMDEQNLSRVPTRKEFRKTERGKKIAAAIDRVYGGARKLRDYLDDEQLRQENGSFDSEEKILDKVREIMEEHGLERLPNANRLREMGYNTLAQTIAKIGYRNVRVKLGETKLEVPKGKWMDMEFLIEQAHRFMREYPEYEELPGSWTLNRTGFSQIPVAAHKYHGCYSDFRRSFNEHLGRQPSEEESSLLEQYVGGNER